MRLRTLRPLAAVALLGALAFASPAGAQADVLARLTAPSVAMEGDLAADGVLAALELRHDEAGETKGPSSLSFRLEAEGLHMETDARYVTQAGGAVVPRGDPHRMQETRHDVRITSMKSQPGHAFTVLPEGPVGVGLHAEAMELAAASPRTVTVAHRVDPDREALDARLDPSVRVTALPEGSVALQGDMVIVVWGWSFLLDDGGSERTIRTGYEAQQDAKAPVVEEGVEQGRYTQVYLHATNATLRVFPDSDQAPGMYLTDASVVGARHVIVPSAAGTLLHSGREQHVTGSDVSMEGRALAVDVDRARQGVLGLQVEGEEAHVQVAGNLVPTGPTMLLPVLGLALLTTVAAAAGTAFLAIRLRSARHAPWRLSLAARLLPRRPRMAAWVLRMHLRADPECMEGLLLLATTHRCRGRHHLELMVRLRADRVLVDEERVENARRILHLYASTGQGEQALEWFEQCRSADPGLVRELMSAPVFQALGRDQDLRRRAQVTLGWHDPTGA